MTQLQAWYRLNLGMPGFFEILSFLLQNPESKQNAQALKGSPLTGLLWPLLAAACSFKISNVSYDHMNSHDPIYPFYIL